MTTQDFLHKVQFRGRMENLREAQQGTRLIFALLKEYFSSDPYRMLGKLSDDIRGLWWVAEKRSGQTDWFTYLENEINRHNLSTSAHELTKAVLFTLREAVGGSMMRRMSFTLPDEVRGYSF